MHRLKLYEPPIDDGDDDDQETSHTVEDSLAGYAAFMVCLTIGGLIAVAVLAIGNLFVP